MTLLTIIQDATQDLGLAEPTSVVGNNDKKIVQLLQLANREGRNLASRYNWSSLIKQVTFFQDSYLFQFMFFFYYFIVQE